MNDYPGQILTTLFLSQGITGAEFIYPPPNMAYVNPFLALSVLRPAAMLKLDLNSTVIWDSVVVVAKLPLRPVILKVFSSDQQHWVTFEKYTFSGPIPELLTQKPGEGEGSVCLL